MQIAFVVVEVTDLDPAFSERPTAVFDNLQAAKLYAVHRFTEREAGADADELMFSQNPDAGTGILDPRYLNRRNAAGDEELVAVIHPVALNPTSQEATG